MQNGISAGIRTGRRHVFARFGADLYARSVLLDKISATELSRKFIKSALLVGVATAEIGTISCIMLIHFCSSREGRERRVGEVAHLAPPKKRWGWYPFSSSSIWFVCSQNTGKGVLFYVVVVVVLFLPLFFINYPAWSSPLPPPFRTQQYRIGKKENLPFLLQANRGFPPPKKKLLREKKSIFFNSKQKLLWFIIITRVTVIIFCESFVSPLLTQPPTVVCKVEAQSGYAHIACLAPICMLSRCLLTIFFCIGAQSEIYQERVVGWVSRSILSFPPSPSWFLNSSTRGRNKLLY